EEAQGEPGAPPPRQAVRRMQLGGVGEEEDREGQGEHPVQDVQPLRQMDADELTPPLEQRLGPAARPRAQGHGPSRVVVAGVVARAASPLVERAATVQPERPTLALAWRTRAVG